MSLQITISGDFCITPSYVGNDLVAADIASVFAGQDYNMVNLECPVTTADEANKITKLGPHLRSTEELFKQLSLLKVDLVTLANNHILDYGIAGLESTLKGCKKNKIAYAGVGRNLEEASACTVIEKNGLTIAVINCCENEWSIATAGSPGANPLDIIDVTAQIKKAKQAADFVLLIIHGGNESYHLPSPRMVKQFRFLAGQGADAVICHHAHCFSGMELYQGVPIFYGLGNLIFTTPNDVPGWYDGITVQFNVEKNKALKWSIIPTVQSKDSYRVSLANETDRVRIINEFERLSTIIVNGYELEAAWQTFIELNTAQYLHTFSAMNVIPGRYLKAVLKRLGFMNWLFPEKYLKGIINYINCEAHLDVSRGVLSKKLYNK